METPKLNWFQKIQWWSKLSAQNKILTLLLVIAIAATTYSKVSIDERVRVYEERAVRAEARVDSCHKDKTALEIEFRLYMRSDRNKTESLKNLVDSTIKSDVQ